jgi:excisionase family DNA binding protein
MEGFMTVTDAATVLGVEVSTLRRRLEAGVMKGERIHARLWLIPREEVDRWRKIGRLKRGPKPKRAGQSA